MTDPFEAPRISARGLVFDEHGRCVLLRRSRSGRAPYLVMPGGGVEAGESLRDAVARECFEELGARVTVGEVVYVAYQDEPAPGAVQRFFLCRLDSIDDAAKTGHEFREEWRGAYETVRVGPGDAALVELRPVEVAELIRRHHDVFQRELAALP